MLARETSPLLNYSCIICSFFAPLFASLVLANLLAGLLTEFFQANTYVLTNLFMVILSLVLFFFIVPYVRRKENIQGVRRALVGFLLVSFFITLPAIIKGNYGLLLSMLIPIANYILLTFIYCPEVLGMDVDIGTWFEHYKQLTILLVYGGMILLYVFGFGWLYYQMALDTTWGPAFDSPDATPQYSTYIYYSVIIFGTIGFGDITPVTRVARFTSSFEAILALIINVIFIAILFVYVSNFREFLKKEEKELERAEKVISRMEKKQAHRPKRKAKPRKHRARRKK